MPLTALAITRIVAGSRPYKKADSGGLYLLVQPNGSLLWRMDYRFDGKRKTLALGSYPTTGLGAARAARDDARSHLEARRDPASVRKTEQRARKIAASNTFEAVGERWANKMESEGRPARTVAALRRHIKRAAKIKRMPVAEVSPTDILEIVRDFEKAGRDARRFRSTLSRVFRFAIAEGLAANDPTAALAGALVVRPTGHYPSPKDPLEIGRVLHTITEYPGARLTCRALLVLAYTMLRPKEVREGEWSEVDWKARTWVIPAARMKMTRDHIVPLSNQVEAMLREQWTISGASRFIFPAFSVPGKPMGAMTMNAALVRIGYGPDYLVPHGFRSMASTTLNESGRFQSDWVERQLAHAERDGSRAAYNAALYLPQRTVMMQWYADWLDRQRDMAELLG